MKSTKILNDTLPCGWEERKYEDGTTYYIDHNTSTAHIKPPIANIAAGGMIRGKSMVRPRAFKKLQSSM